MGLLYDAVMKGPPRWFIRGLFLFLVLCIGVQLGLWHERSKQMASAINAELAKKDAAMDRLKVALNDAQYDLEVERTKLRIILCESNVRHTGVWGDGGKSYGICQFQYATFKDLREEAGRPELRWKNRDDQLWLLDWALRHGYGGRWACYKKTTEVAKR